MGSVAIMVVSFAGYIIAYKTYGRYLAGRIFGIDPQARTPAHELRDEVDYMPAKKEVLFGHHFTSIAGVGTLGPKVRAFVDGSANMLQARVL